MTTCIESIDQPSQFDGKLTEKLTSLASVQQGNLARIVSVDADSELKKRLLSMGLGAGSLLHIVQKRGNAIVVGFDASRIAIDSGMSCNIAVEVS